MKISKYIFNAIFQYLNLFKLIEKLLVQYLYSLNYFIHTYINK